ncbi:hypothetical protein [Ferribacterium limneticum]|uniref:hypothetical protein n=1 Tax=Ferribacterium limneticum TaxID=76259 RepID=UPI001CFA776B|nr:hypothetical protein [Ferribacterium limneticum]UCV19285.1 hypothetical protein KI610_01465 [Ferribacterium limneticum]
MRSVCCRPVNDRFGKATPRPDDLQIVPMGISGGEMEASGFMATKYCMDIQLNVEISHRASETCRPVRQLIGQISGLGDSFVVYY